MDNSFSTSLGEIKKNLIQNANQYFSNLHIEFVYLAGSVARNEIHQESDIDLFIAAKQYSELSSKQKYDFLNEILTALNPLKIDNLDIQILQEVRLDIQLKVLREGICIFDLNPEERQTYIERTMNVGFDFEIWINGYLESALEM